MDSLAIAGNFYLFFLLLSFSNQLRVVLKFRKLRTVLLGDMQNSAKSVQASFLILVSLLIAVSWPISFIIGMTRK